jgi:hypothetical protein
MIEFGYETDSISIPKISLVLLHGNESIAMGHYESIREMYFFDLQVELCSSERWDGTPIKEALHIDPPHTSVMEDVIPGEVGTKVKVDEHCP